MTLHGSVGRSGADNFRPDVAKVETFLGDAGYYKPLTSDGPSGWQNANLDQAIRSFQKDKGLEVDGFLKPNGPTIGKIGSLLGGSDPQESAQPSDPWEVKVGGRDPGDTSTLKPPAWWQTTGDGGDAAGDPAPFPNKPQAPQPEGDVRERSQPEGGLTPPQQLEALIRIMNGGKPGQTPPAQLKPPPGEAPDDEGWDPHGGCFGTGGWKPGYPKPKLGRPADPFPNHTINQEGIDANQGYAEMLVRDSDPSQTARLLKRAIDDYGDQGRGDVANLLARFQKIDGAKAETLRRELHKASGEMLPYRLAPLGVGFREPTEEEKIAAAPKTPFGSAQGADRWAAGTMADVLLGRSDYANAITHFRGEIGRNSAETMPYLAAVHQIMDDKNPAAAANFATQMHKAGLTSASWEASASAGDNADDGKIHIRLDGGPEPAGSEGAGGGAVEGTEGNSADGQESGQGPTGEVSSTVSSNSGDGQEEQVASTENGGGDNVNGGSGGQDGQSEGHQTPDLEKFKEQALGRGKGYGSGQCVDLVRNANPGLPQSTKWEEGSKITGAGNPPLKPGTAIATFDADGKYHGERSTGQHAAIFLEYSTENGKPGMMVLDQWRGQPPHVRFVPFDDGKKRQNNAGAYSVIK